MYALYDAAFRQGLANVLVGMATILFGMAIVTFAPIAEFSLVAVPAVGGAGLAFGLAGFALVLWVHGQMIRPPLPAPPQR